MFDIIKKIYNRLTTDGSTEEQTIQSGIWLSVLNVGDRVLQLVKVIVIARILSPKAFGLLGIALLVFSGLRSLSSLGFDAALVQNKNENIDPYLNTAWLIKIARGLLITIIAFFAAPYLAELFNEPQSQPLIRVIVAANLLLSLQNPAVVYFTKNLNFHKEFVYQLGGRLVDISVAVVLALILKNVWALAWGITAMNFTKFCISYLIHDFRPNIEFNSQYGKEMFGFGKWMFVTSILLFIFLQGDDAFVGWFFGATILGYYQLGYRFSNAPATEVAQVISRVAYPAFSKIQNEISKLRTGFYRVLQFSVVISFPMAAGIVAVTPQFVPVIFGKQWSPMIPLMQGLAVWGGIRSVTNYGAIFKAVGRPDLDTKLAAVRVIILAAFIYPASESLGIMGVIYVIIFQNLITQPLGMYLSLKLIGGKFSKVLSLTIYPLLGSLLMAVVVMIVDTNILNQTGVAQVCFLVFVGIVSYLIFMISIERLTTFEFTSIYYSISDSI
jgi:O-antigen/teichoic acid export membrane protein